MPAGHFICEGLEILPLLGALAGEGSFGRFAPATSQEACGPQAVSAYSHSASRMGAVLKARELAAQGSVFLQHSDHELRAAS